MIVIILHSFGAFFLKRPHFLLARFSSTKLSSRIRQNLRERRAFPVLTWTKFLSLRVETKNHAKNSLAQEEQEQNFFPRRLIRFIRTNALDDFRIVFFCAWWSFATEGAQKQELEKAYFGVSLSSSLSFSSHYVALFSLRCLSIEQIRDVSLSTHEHDVYIYIYIYVKISSV